MIKFKGTSIRSMNLLHLNSQACRYSLTLYSDRANGLFEVSFDRLGDQGEGGGAFEANTPLLLE